jgi:hypothetical protein
MYKMQKKIYIVDIMILSFLQIMASYYDILVLLYTEISHTIFVNI